MKGKTFRKNSLLRIFAAVMTVVSLVVSQPFEMRANASSIDSDMQQLEIIQQRLAEAEAARKTASSQYASAKALYDDAAAEQADALAVKGMLDKEISAIQEEIDSTNELLREYNTLLEEYRVQIADKKNEIDTKYEQFKERMRLSYENSYVSYLEMILSSGSFYEMLVRVETVGSMLEYDARLMRELEAARADLEETEGKYQALQVEAQERLADLNEKVPELEAKKKENAELLAKLSEEVQKTLAAANATAAEYNRAQQIENTYSAQQDAVEKEIQRKIAEAQQREQEENYIGGVLRWPLPLSISKITSGFGMRSDPFSGQQKMHNGIDIPASYGTNVYAAGSGKVIIATWHYSYGNYVVIDHGGGITTLYAHNSSLTVSVGQTVTAGSVIAHVGATGSATGNHLHFSVTQNGVFQNPLAYVNQP